MFWAIAYVGTATRIWPAANRLVFILALGGFVAAVAMAILKYRLYDVDLVINRTLLYGGLAASITGCMSRWWLAWAT